MKATIICQMKKRELEAKTLKGLKMLAVKTVTAPHFASSPNRIEMYLEDGTNLYNRYNGFKFMGWNK